MTDPVPPTERGVQSGDEARFRAVVESAPNSMVMIDAEGAIVLVNAQTERLFGYRREDLLGRTIETLVPDGFRASHPRLRDEFLADPRSRPMGAGRDLFGLRSDGSEVPVEIGLNPIRTEEGLFVLAAVVDITERRRAEERFRLVVESAPSAMVMVDAAGRVVLVNALTEKLFGWDRKELLGRSIEVLVPERFRARHPEFRTSFFEDLRSRPMGADRDLFGLRRDGTEMPVEIGLNPIRTHEGSFVLAAIVDITERRRAQLELAQKNEEVEAFVYIVSHDLRAPLVNLQGFSRELALSCNDLKAVIASSDLPSENASRAEKILDRDIPTALHYISASTVKFERLINALLALSRSGRREYRHQVLDMTALVASTLDAVRSSIDETGAEVVVGPLPKCWGDRTSVEQVFSNLVANALHYADPGRPSRIAVGGARRDAFVHYWVTDNGVGIPDAARSRLFQVFQRFHPELAGGEGMGLATVKRVVERHGGRVWCDSRVGEGSTFHLTLPAREPPEE